MNSSINITRGVKRYELTNHLGNVNVVITDKRVLVCNADTVTYYTADVVSANDYSPFGAPLAGRTWYSDTISQYRFHFNGKETDNEVKGAGNSQDFGARIYNPRLGNFLSVDPLSYKYAAISPYVYCYNSPINVVDVDGKEGIVVSGQPGDHKGREHFLMNGLNRAKQLSKQFAKEGNGEKVTWFVYSNGGDGGYDQKTLDKYAKLAAKNGITLQVVDNAKTIVKYVNEKTGDDSRANDKVSNFFYLGHATPGDLDVGFEDHSPWNLTFNDKIEPSDFKSEAFKSGTLVDVVGGCRTAVSGNLPGEKSVIDQFADKLDSKSTIKGSSVRVYYPGTVVSDEQLVAPNKGSVVEIKGKSTLSQ